MPRKVEVTIFYVLFDASVSFCGSLNHGDGTRLRISSQEGSSRKGFLFCFVVMHVCFLLLVTLILPIECSFPIEKTHLFLLQFSSAWWLCNATMKKHLANKFFFCFAVMHVCFLLVVTLILHIECSFAIECSFLHYFVGFVAPS